MDLKEKCGNEILFKITEQGNAKIQEINQKFPGDVQKQFKELIKKIEKLKKEKNKIPLRTLITYVYQKYPDYTINSEIRHKINY